MRNRIKLFVLTLCALGAACGQDGTRVLVSADPLPQGVEALRAQATLDGAMLSGVSDIEPGQPRFFLLLPTDRQGLLQVVVSGVSGGCAVARGSGQVRLDGAAYYPLPVALAPLPKAECGDGGGGVALTVALTSDGEGTVVSEPAGISCGTSCVAAFAPGTQVRLTAHATDLSAFAGWGGACAGTAGDTCVVNLGAAAQVTARFVPCTPGRLCMEALPAGLSVNGVYGRSAQDMLLWGKQQKASVIYHFDGHTWKQETLPDGAPVATLWGDWAAGGTWLLQRKAGAWQRVSIPVSNAGIDWIAGLAADDIWARASYYDSVTSKTTYYLLRYAGSSWGTVPINLYKSGEYPEQIWGYGSGSGQAWLGSYYYNSMGPDERRLYQRSGPTSWSQVSIDWSPDCLGGGGASNVWSGTTRKYDGSSWAAIQGVGSGCVRGGDPRDMWSTASSGEIYRFDGASWSVSDTLGEYIRNSAWVDGAGLLVVGTGGHLFRRSGR